jgi:hypothetical protein
MPLESELQAEKKAFEINMDPRIYGAFAEIGAGQEVARRFFSVGGAAGTVAKTISAYDMTFSDAIYGACGRYVSRARLHSMLTHEYSLLIERLDAKVGGCGRFSHLRIPSRRVVFADTPSPKAGWVSVSRQSRVAKRMKSSFTFGCSMRATSSSRRR